VPVTLYLNGKYMTFDKPYIQLYCKEVYCVLTILFQITQLTHVLVLSYGLLNAPSAK